MAGGWDGPEGVHAIGLTVVEGHANEPAALVVLQSHLCAVCDSVII